MGFGFPQSSGGNYSGTGGRRFKFLPIIIFAIIAFVYFQSNKEVVPLTGRTQVVGMSREQEAALGLSSFQQVLSENHVIQSGPSADMVRRIGQRLALVSEDPGFEWEFTLLESGDANAFCLPGGKVAVYSGILPITQTESGLAVVMGHEIAHAIARHGAERMAHQQLAQFAQIAVGMSTNDMDPNTRRAVLGAFGVGAQFGLLLPFSRKHESEADYMGLQFVARACYDPREALQVWQRMSDYATARKPPEYLSTHPSDETRIRQFEQWMPEALAIYNERCKQ